MLPARVREIVAESHNAVLTTFRSNGTAQMSVVSAGPYQDGVAFAACDYRAKVVNLTRDPRCTLLVSRPDWSDYVVMEGKARISSPGNTDTEALRLAHRDLQRTIGGEEHADWADYDREMREGRYAVVTVVPEHFYGWTGGQVKGAGYFAGA